MTQRRLKRKNIESNLFIHSRRLNKRPAHHEFIASFSGAQEISYATGLQTINCLFNMRKACYYYYFSFQSLIYSQAQEIYRFSSRSD